ncbi:MAG: hypothetical protein C0501_25650 [Isosphaera sp.]|nr:hypothetical protein [Isosphaera sp.]
MAGERGHGLVGRGPLGAWYLAGCGLVAATLWGHLAWFGWGPAALLQVGEVSPARGRIERELGTITLAPTQGHDGKYFYLIARCPWPAAADPELLDGLQDPGYRYARPLYPLLAGLGGTLPPRATVAGLLAVQVLAGGLLVAATVALARRNRLPTLAVAVGLSNPGVYSSAVLLTSDLLAFALALAGLAAWQRGRTGVGVVLFAAAALAKEYYALTPLALAAATARDRPGPAAAVGLLPLLPILAWKAVVAWAVGVGEGAGNFSWPGAGAVAAAPGWTNPYHGALAVALVVVSLAAVVRAGRTVPRWQCLVWGVLGAVTARVVWADPADLLRVVCPAWWFAVWCWWPDRR